MAAENTILIIYSAFKTPRHWPGRLAIVIGPRRGVGVAFGSRGCGGGGFNISLTQRAASAHPSPAGGGA